MGQKLWLLPRQPGGLFLVLPRHHPVVLRRQHRRQPPPRRAKSDYISRLNDESNHPSGGHQQDVRTAAAPLPPPLSILPLPFLLRSLMITTVLTSPRLLKPSLALLTLLCNSKSPVLNPDKNLLLHAVLRTLFYNQYCAGESDVEVQKTVATIKGMGFKGVILGYAKEMVVDPKATMREGDASMAQAAADDVGSLAIASWREGSMRTLQMLGADDFLAIKFTGAGPAVTEALTKGNPPPPAFWKAISEVCEKAAGQGTRVWIDAEQQVYQDTIDAWTTDLMRRFNRNTGKDKAPGVYTTFQAYLKASAANIARHMELASKEGWTLAIKLVRGAYIAIEPRHLIHDTKEATDNAYNSIVASLLTRSFPGAPFPKDLRLFIASHNEESVRKAHALHRSRILAGQPTLSHVEYGQLQGMADDVSCRLLQLAQIEPASPSCQPGRAMATESGEKPKQPNKLGVPVTFKCLAWGTTGECVQFLVRRTRENKDAVQRTRQGLVDSRIELWRRVRNSLRLGGWT